MRIFFNNAKEYFRNGSFIGRFLLSLYCLFYLAIQVIPKNILTQNLTIVSACLVATFAIPGLYLVGVFLNRDSYEFGFFQRHLIFIKEDDRRESWVDRILYVLCFLLILSLPLTPIIKGDLERGYWETIQIFPIFFVVLLFSVIFPSGGNLVVGEGENKKKIILLASLILLLVLSFLNYQKIIY